jgi:hypothetical protein
LQAASLFVKLYLVNRMQNEPELEN